MLRNRRKDFLIALVLIAPFVAIYALVFVYPTVQMFRISFTDAPLIGHGDWVGITNYAKLRIDPRFRTAIWNTAYFVLLTRCARHAGCAGNLAWRLAACAAVSSRRCWRCSSCPTSCRSRWSTASGTGR